MAKTATLTMRLDPQVKANAESVYSVYGISLSEAIDIFLHKSILEGGLPFSLKQPRYNRETEEAIFETQMIVSGVKAPAESFSTAEAAIESLKKELE